MNYSTFGRHVAADLWGVDFERINSAEYLQTQMIEAAERCGATVLSVQDKQFEPQGVTVLLLLSESHLSIHTYPEKGLQHWIVILVEKPSTQRLPSSICYQC